MIGRTKLHGQSSQAWIVFPRRASGNLCTGKNRRRMTATCRPLGQSDCHHVAVSAPGTNIHSLYPLRTSIPIFNGSPGKSASKFTLLFIGDKLVKKRRIIGRIQRTLPRPTVGNGSHFATNLTPLSRPSFPYFSLNISKYYPHISPPRSKKNYGCWICFRVQAPPPKYFEPKATK